MRKVRALLRAFSEVIDFNKLGAGMLAVSTTLIQLGGSKTTWWVGFVLALVAPLLLAVKPVKKRAR